MCVYCFCGDWAFKHYPPWPPYDPVVPWPPSVPAPVTPAPMIPWDLSAPRRWRRGQERILEKSDCPLFMQ
jgi:hypothetical protein